MQEKTDPRPALYTNTDRVEKLISSKYADLNRQLHAERHDYGSGAEWAPHIVQMARENGSRVIFDYGCGKGGFKRAVGTLAPEMTVLEYDPAVPGKDTVPAGKPDLLVALDVMEHIEPEFLHANLALMRQINPIAVFMSIALEPAQKTLSDGRNAHILLESPEWWVQELGKHFQPVGTQVHKGHFIYIANPLP